MKAKSRDGAQSGIPAALAALEQKMIVEALQRGGTIQATADSLNISISQLNTRMAQFGIQRNVKVQRTVKVTFKKN